MDRMADSGSVGWGFESLRDRKVRQIEGRWKYFCLPFFFVRKGIQNFTKIILPNKNIVKKVYSTIFVLQMLDSNFFVKHE